jgi:translocation and assembly module TamB
MAVSCNFTFAARHLKDTDVAWRLGFAQLGEMEEQEDHPLPTRRFKKRWIFGAVFLLLLILVAIAWWQRYRIADDLIRDQLKQTGARVSYKIEELGFRKQRISNIVVGDPANPDFAAKSVEIDLAIGFGTPAIRSISVNGARLKGRYADGKFSFGELDKFRDPNSKEPFKLPDLKITVADTKLVLATPWGDLDADVAGEGNLAKNFNTKTQLKMASIWGDVEVRLEGAGNLAETFNSKMVLQSPKLTGGGCAATMLGFGGNLRIKNRQPELIGPINASNLSCPKQGIMLAGPELKGNIKLSEKFDNWVGDYDFVAGNARLSGQQLNSPAGKVSFFGNKAQTDFDFALLKASFRSNDISVTKLSGDAKGRLAIEEDGIKISARGAAQANGASMPANMLDGLSSLATNTKETPIGPIIAALDPALKGALQSFNAKLNYDISTKPDKSAYVKISGLDIAAKSGAQITQSGPLTFSGAQLTSPVSFALSGGGLPDADVAVRRQGSGWAGTLAIAPYARGGASLNVPQFDFTGGVGRPWKFTGQATLSGPLMGGRIEGLSLPIDGSWSGGTFSMLSGCKPIRFTRFQTGSLNLASQSLQACADGGSILQAGRGGTRFAMRSPSLNGNASLGNTPVAFKGANVRFSLSDGFVANNITVDLGRADALTQFSMAKLDGRFGRNGISGMLEGGAGKIGNVPLLIDEASGKWAWNNGSLTLDGSTRISDAEQVARFNPLIAPEMQIAMDKGIISAIGYLNEPKTGIRIADVDIKHELATSIGRGLFSVDDLTFGDRLQPDMLTRLTLGAVANVNGAIYGDGRIEWSSNGVKSSGKFGTNSLDFAAAFGPVSGMATEVNFTDLLGMETAPGQLAKIGVANPGVPAFDGRLNYRLLPDQKVQIEGGRWPFYGGELILEPTILDFDVQAKRELTFRMVGLDAEQFLATYDLSNVRVSGVFDGTLPMVFDQEGGKIVGGWLVSRKGGGEVSYLGQLAYEDMGYFANFAFSALRSIKFEEMQIGVDGNVGGEVITEVRFRGLQQGSQADRNFITKQLSKIPIEFNVKIQAKFLQLIDDLRQLYDPRYAAQRYKAQREAERKILGITEDTQKTETKQD